MRGCSLECESVEVGLPIDGRPFGDLVQQPREAEPDLADHAGQPQRVRIRVGVEAPPAEKDHHHAQPQQNNETAAQRQETRGHNRGREGQLIGKRRDTKRKLWFTAVSCSDLKQSC